MGQSLIQRTFAGGELAPALHARADLVKYVTGLRTCRNFLILRSGGVANRPGTRYIATTRGGTEVFLLRYVSEVPANSVLIEAGQFYLRFYQQGAPVTLTGVVAWSGATAYAIGDIAVSGGVNYYCIKAHANHVPPNGTYWYAMPGSLLELPTPFGNAGFAWEQQGNVLTLTSQLVPPQELICLGLTQWVIQSVATQPQVGAPTALVPSGGAAGTLSRQYRVTAGATGTYEESLPSPIAQITNILVPTVTVPIVLNWTAPAIGTAVEYYVYCDPFENGVFGFMGTAAGATTFNDTGQTPDFTVTPPQPRVLFNATGDYPAVSGAYQQRRFFADTVNNPDAIWGSRTGLRSNFNISSPLQDDDALTFRIAGKQRNAVRQLVGLKTLVVITDGGEWAVQGPNGVLTPSGILADQQTYIGSAPVRAVTIGNAVLYVQARGSIISDLRFDYEVQGFAGRDLTAFATHLFDGFTLLDMDLQLTPHSTVWCCRSDGTLLGLTYLRDQDVYGWHRHDTGALGAFVHVCVVPEPGQDVAYFVVQRTINNNIVHYIEKLEHRDIHNYALDSFFVDAGLTYSGAPVTTISGLDHLEGEIVAVVGDGTVVFDGDPTAAKASSFRVTGGTLPAPLPAAYRIIHAGLPIRFAEIETLDLDVQGSQIRDKKKRVGTLNMLIDASARTFKAGPTSAQLVKYDLKPYEAGPQAAYTGQVEMILNADYNDYGRVLIRQTDPLPLSILGVLPNVEIGG